jgi:hypothetical protein
MKSSHLAFTWTLCCAIALLGLIGCGGGDDNEYGGVLSQNDSNQQNTTNNNTPAPPDNNNNDNTPTPPDNTNNNTIDPAPGPVLDPTPVPTGGEGAASPNELLRTMSRICNSSSARGAGELIHPDYRSFFVPLLEGLFKVHGQYRTLARLSEQKLTAQHASGFRDEGKQFDPAAMDPLSSATTNGNVDWSKVKWSDEPNNRKRYEIVGGTDDDDGVIENINGRWYFVPGANDGQTLAQTKTQVASYSKHIDQVGKVLADLIAGLQDGSITQANFLQQVQQINLKHGLM